jgi:hypothetical protein
MLVPSAETPRELDPFWRAAIVSKSGSSILQLSERRFMHGIWVLRVPDDTGLMKSFTDLMGAWGIRRLYR